MKFLQVDPNAIEAMGVVTSRGGVIGPIVQGFLETNFFMAEVDCSELGRKASSVSASVAAFSKQHILPVRPVLRMPKLYLQRRDVDREGKPIENWKDELLATHVQGATIVAPTLTIEAISLQQQKTGKK